MADNYTPDEVYMQMLGRLDVHRALITEIAQHLPRDAQVGLMNKLNMFAAQPDTKPLGQGQSEEAEMLRKAFFQFGFRTI